MDYFYNGDGNPWVEGDVPCRPLFKFMEVYDLFHVEKYGSEKGVLCS